MQMLRRRGRERGQAGTADASFVMTDAFFLAKPPPTAFGRENIIYNILTTTDPRYSSEALSGEPCCKPNRPDREGSAAQPLRFDLLLGRA